MSGKQDKKLRQLVRREQGVLANQSWDCFFYSVSQLKFRYRLKLAWLVLLGKDLRAEEQKKALKRK